MIKVIQNFLRNKRATNYRTLVKDVISAFKFAGINMSYKIYFLDDHLEDFPNNCGDYSDEQGERFHQDIALIEKRYKGKDKRHMLEDYC